MKGDLAASCAASLTPPSNASAATAKRHNEKARGNMARGRKLIGRTTAASSDAKIEWGTFITARNRANADGEAARSNRDLIGRLGDRTSALERGQAADTTRHAISGRLLFRDAGGRELPAS